MFAIRYRLQIPLTISILSLFARICTLLFATYTYTQFLHDKILSPANIVSYLNNCVKTE